MPLCRRQHARQRSYQLGWEEVLKSFVTSADVAFSYEPLEAQIDINIKVSVPYTMASKFDHSPLMKNLNRILSTSNGAADTLVAMGMAIEQEDKE